MPTIKLSMMPLRKRVRQSLKYIRQTLEISVVAGNKVLQVNYYKEMRQKEPVPIVSFLLHYC